jgi:hypothetical protein
MGNFRCWPIAPKVPRRLSDYSGRRSSRAWTATCLTIQKLTLEGRLERVVWIGAQIVLALLPRLEVRRSFSLINHCFLQKPS